MSGGGHIESPGVERKMAPKRKKAARCGCGLLENLAELAVHRSRRTRRDPSSSIERRRKVARRLVRLNVITSPIQPKCLSCQGCVCKWVPNSRELADIFVSRFDWTEGTLIGKSAGPLAATDRLASLDIPRGLALFGVMAINLVFEFRVSIFEQFCHSVRLHRRLTAQSRLSWTTSYP